MNGRYERDDLEDMHEASPAADREISLGTGAMLGIFFALVLVCGAFFGFGYSVGHKATPGVPTATGVTGDLDGGGAAQVAGDGTRPAVAGQGDTPIVVVKPSAGSTPAVSKKAPAKAVDTTDDPGSATPPAPVERIAPKPAVVEKTTPAAPLTSAVAAPALPVKSTSAAPTTLPGAAPIFVQISAVSHQEDAQLMISALRRRGYDAAVRHEPTDQLLHIQLGPYGTKKDADAMRQRLSADGYNAILK